MVDGGGGEGIVGGSRVRQVLFEPIEAAHYLVEHANNSALLGERWKRYGIPAKTFQAHLLVRDAHRNAQDNFAHARGSVEVLDEMRFSKRGMNPEFDAVRGYNGVGTPGWIDTRVPGRRPHFRD